MSKRIVGNETEPAILTFSVVSHRQGTLVRGLLEDLRSVGIDLSVCQIILTLNAPEDEEFLKGFTDLPLEVVRNKTQKGFGANHNAAFALSIGELFVVINPDLRLETFDLSSMSRMLALSGVGAYTPLVLSRELSIEDNARKFPTFASLARRVLFGERAADYVVGAEPVRVDWVAGMFMGFRSAVFAEVGGFDERYFMYMEDADICRRLHASGRDVLIDPSWSVIHDARRASRRNLRHMIWHLRSAVRFLLNV